VPVADLPEWSWKVVRLRLRRLFRDERHLPSWGPRFAGMDAALHTQTLPSVAALQWARCAVRSRADLAALSPERVYRVRYEQLVSWPRAEISRLLDWCGVEPVPELMCRMAAAVHSDRVGRGRAQLGRRTFAEIAPIVAEVGART
jgi:hypothetical protein